MQHLKKFNCVDEIASFSGVHCKPIIGIKLKYIDLMGFYSVFEALIYYS